MTTPKEKSWILNKLLAAYGSWYAIAKALGGSNQRVYQWKARGYAPETAALDIEDLKQGIDAKQVLLEARHYRGQNRTAA